MSTETPTPHTVVLSTAQLERIDDLAEWFTDNPNHSDIKEAIAELVRDVAFAEREACAKVCFDMSLRAGGCNTTTGTADWECGEAIVERDCEWLAAQRRLNMETTTDATRKETP